MELEEDRISTLPDELIHHILSFLDTKLSVEMCVLSKRWINLWRTLPYLNFGDNNYSHYNNRDLLRVDKEEFLNYAISHNVKHLEISNLFYKKCNFSFPVLETLHLTSCSTLFTYWSLPSLTTLYLNHIDKIPLSFEGFSNLKNLTIDTCKQLRNKKLLDIVDIKLPNLCSLVIFQWTNSGNNTPILEFRISAPKLSSFSYFGNYVSAFSTKCGGGYPSLEEVIFGFDPDEICGNISGKYEEPIMDLTSLLCVFSGAKFLTLSLKTVQVLLSFLESPNFLPSPFRNLKTLHLVDHVSAENINIIDSINHVINYLLKSSSDMKVTVKDCGGKIRSYNPKTDKLYKNVCGYCKVKSKENASLDRQAASNVQVSGDEPHRVFGVIPPALLPCAVNDNASSFNKKSTFSLGDASQIQEEDADLLTRIKEEHAETFEHFAPRTEFIYTRGLNALCSSVKTFCEDSKAGLTVLGITCYRDLFADLQRLGFNTTWLVNLLNSTDKKSAVGHLTVMESEDRISALPDELISHILSFLNTKLAVEMCILSKRWVNFWRTLPYLNFRDDWPHYSDRRKFITNFLKNRDKNSDTPTVVVDLIDMDEEEFLKYAISHNVKHLEIRYFSHMKYYLSFPVLETLHLTRCDCSFMCWSLRSLTSLYLKEISRGNMPISFEGFSNLNILTIDTGHLCKLKVLEIKLPHLTSLTISHRDRTPFPKFIISAPKLSSFSYFGNYLSVFSTEGGGYPNLKDVVFGFDPDVVPSWGNITEKQIMDLISLLCGFHGAKCLKLSFKTVQVFSSFLESPEFWPSPFRNLKTLHLIDPVSNQIINQIDSVNHVINYLLNSSPDMKIFVKDCSAKHRSYNPKKDLLYQNDCGYCKVKSRGNTSLDRQAACNLQVSGDESQRVCGMIPPALVPSTVNDDASSVNEKNSLSLGDVSQIHSEYTDLLTWIKEEHPETLEHFAPRTECIYTWGLNTLCSSVKAFYKDFKAGFTVSGITCYRDLFTDLERLGFNTTWLVNILNNVDRNSCVGHPSH